MGDSRSKRFPAEDNPFSRLDSDPLERLMMIMIMLMMTDHDHVDDDDDDDDDDDADDDDDDVVLTMQYVNTNGLQMS